MLAVGCGHQYSTVGWQRLACEPKRLAVISEAERARETVELGIWIPGGEVLPPGNMRSICGISVLYSGLRNVSVYPVGSKPKRLKALLPAGVAVSARTLAWENVSPFRSTYLTFPQLTIYA